MGAQSGRAAADKDIFAARGLVHTEMRMTIGFDQRRITFQGDEDIADQVVRRTDLVRRQPSGYNRLPFLGTRPALDPRSLRDETRCATTFRRYGQGHEQGGKGYL